jgi:hypothetical protein
VNVGGTVLQSCPVTSFGVRIDELLGSAATELIYVVAVHWSLPSFSHGLPKSCLKGANVSQLDRNNLHKLSA